MKKKKQIPSFWKKLETAKLFLCVIFGKALFTSWFCSLKYLYKSITKGNSWKLPFPINENPKITCSRKSSPTSSNLPPWINKVFSSLLEGFEIKLGFNKTKATLCSSFSKEYTCLKLSRPGSKRSIRGNRCMSLSRFRFSKTHQRIRKAYGILTRLKNGTLPLLSS